MAIETSWLRPYTSLLVLQCAGAEVRPAFAECGQRSWPLPSGLSTPRSSGKGWLVETSNSRSKRGPGRIRWRRSSTDGSNPPAGATGSAPYVDVTHLLVVAIRVRDLIAVYSDATLREALQAWLHREPEPPLRRVPASVLGIRPGRDEESLAEGNTHAPRDASRQQEPERQQARRGTQSCRGPIVRSRVRPQPPP